MKEHNQVFAINLHSPRRVIGIPSPIFPMALKAVFLLSQEFSLEENKCPLIAVWNFDKWFWF